MVTVRMMALCREERRNRQMKAIEKHRMPCLSFTLNIPGPVKDSEKIRRIHRIGRETLKSAFPGKITEIIIRQDETGPEAYFSINLDSSVIKKTAIEIEENHTLGRIFDMDVIGIDGVSLSRRQLNYPPRKCLLCEEEAACCARSRAHALEEILQKIESITSDV